MTRTEPARRSLADVLRAEGDALVSGDFAALDRLAAARDAAMESLDDDADLTLIRRLAQRNQRLAAAATAGVASARRRLAQALEGASFDTYARDGSRQKYAEPRPILHRRA